ncbi:MAG: AAA family ATPase, partial [Candidatus Kuenenia stuttgartiensis]|nr:AAA family ATPase [Candidatus Kuenenia stuttgartiensis]
NVCDICQSISEGSDIDVLEIDGASNRGIDEIRNIRQNVGFAPSRARYRIYIIDEVHMLTREAFNALLKTLEEPPAHVKFIFATTAANRLPETVQSRCQRFDFKNISVNDIGNMQNGRETNRVCCTPYDCKICKGRIKGFTICA